MKIFLTFLFYSFIFYLSKEILVFNEEIILLIAFSIMFVVFVTAGWVTLESTLVTRANEIFFLFDDLYELRIKKLKIVRDVFVTKKYFHIRLKTLLNTVNFNLLYFKYINTILEDFFYLYSYSYLILKEVVLKEFLFIKSFLMNKVITKDNQSNIFSYLTLISNSNLKNVNNLISQNLINSSSELSISNLDTISKNSLLNSFNNKFTSFSKSLNTIYLTNIHISGNNVYDSSNFGLTLQSKLNIGFINFWESSILKTNYYKRVYNNMLFNLINNRFNTFFNKNHSLISSINFNSLLSLLNDNLSISNVEHFLFSLYISNKYLKFNLLSENFIELYYSKFLNCFEVN